MEKNFFKVGVKNPLTPLLKGRKKVTLELEKDVTLHATRKWVSSTGYKKRDKIVSFFFLLLHALKIAFATF